MGRQKKNETDSVLEQLKKHIANNYDDLEDSLLETEESEEDTELALLLERIFSNESESFESNKNSIAHTNNDSNPDLTVDSVESVTEYSICSDLNEEIQHIKIEESEEYVDDTKDVKSEEERVDDVFKAMFGAEHVTSYNGTHTNGNNVMADDFDKSSSLIEPIDIVESNIPADSLIEATDSVILNSEVCHTDELSNIQSNEEESKTSYLLKYNIPIVYSQIETDDFISEGESISVSEDFNHAPTDNNNISKILTPEEYVFDPLQASLSILPLYKPEKDIDFSAISEKTSNEFDINEVTNHISDNKKEMSDRDIALLVKFGYENEISANGETNHANRIVFNNSKNYIPEKHKIIHGYTGNEFSNEAQIPEIQRKYKIDKFNILIKAIIVSLIALAISALNILAMFLEFDQYILMIANGSSLLLVMLILFSRIYSGIISLIKFDANEYSMPAILLIETVICVTAISIFSIGFTDIVYHVSFTGYTLIYIAFVVWAEFIDCVREASTFAFITSDNERYAAERSYTEDKSSENKFRTYDITQKSDDKYIIKKTKFISGYHYKITEGKSESVHMVMTIGILPIIAIILSIINIFLYDNIILGINSAAYILLLFVPISSSLSLSFINYIIFIRLKSNNSVCIGNSSICGATDIDTLVFEDVDVMDIVSCTEIKPGNDTEKTNKWLNIARAVFSTLGGSLAHAISNEKNNEPNISHNIAINSISDNGLDIYFDSSMNILIGDRQYMLSHNIKVKTDVNLTGAIKGAERSVIYMAFERVPQIGFIVNCKIKDSFIEIVSKLKNNKVNIAVKTYEPHINEFYFELNEIDIPIYVIKPQAYEHADPLSVSDANIVSSSPSEICNAIITAKKAAKEYIIHSKIHKLQSVLGCITAFIMAVMLFLPNEWTSMFNLQTAMPIIFYVVSLLMFIPNIIQIIKIIRRK